MMMGMWAVGWGDCVGVGRGGAYRSGAVEGKGRRCTNKRRGWYLGKGKIKLMYFTRWEPPKERGKRKRNVD